MTPEQLKASILQYAIQGKLVEQRPEEGTGEELYQQIQAERQRLIQEKKIKKEKPLAEISEDEIPFDIPESWKWCYIGFYITREKHKIQLAHRTAQLGNLSQHQISIGMNLILQR
jgi:restriction endonuclease S subunit